MSSRQDNNTDNMDEGLPYSHADSTNNYSSQERKDRSRVDAEAFPLPPPSNMYIQQQVLAGQGQTSQQLYAHPGAQQQQPAQYQQGPPTSSSSSKHTQATTSDQHHHHHPTEDAYTHMQEAAPQRQDSASKSPEPLEGTVHPLPASFRALPLLSSDLPHTTINVSHSFVRPNDRGKEVLSFVVFVSPGNGKEGWKVEKMYSDVLSLDQRVRNSVGRGVGKKIANLPEGKLWKDHAPAKVDQRKVGFVLRTLFHS